MKKIYIIAVLFFSFFAFESFANGVKLNKAKYIPIEESGFTIVKPATISTEPPITVCEGSNLTLLANLSIGTTPFTYSWSGPNDFTSSDENPTINNVSISAAGTYTLILTDANANTYTQTTDVIINAKIDPTFEAILPAICKGGISPLLSNTSTEGIVGSWTPSVVSNTATGTYVFTPNTGECANPITLTIFVVNNVNPTFSIPTAICQGDPAPILTPVSNNGIVGTWSPSIVNNTTAGTYIFTPSVGQCANTKTLNITINPTIIIFSPIAPICSEGTLDPLPTTSANGVTGNWTPEFDNTKTTTYTFTPTAGQCVSSTVNLTIVVKPILAVFNTVAPICSGSPLAALPTTSTNGVIGTWAPALDNTITKTYTFTPSAGQCATDIVNLEIVVNPVTIVFSPVSPICSGSFLAPLPTTSSNGVTGTWSPAIDNTTTKTYTFTPTLGQCATNPVTKTIVVNPITTVFNFFIAPICSGDFLAPLPTTSANGVTGTWSPALDNTTTKSYTFTPTPGQCVTATTTIEIVVNSVIAVFTPIAPICFGDTIAPLPTTSSNGITGTWAQDLDNTKTTTYTFTPTPGQCTINPANLTIIVQPLIAIFNAPTTICKGETLSPLPTTSTNGVTGTWTPALDNTTTKTYTFTPDAGQCAPSTTLIITVNQLTTPLFNPIVSFCSGTISPALALTSNNNITGTWNPTSISNTISETYTFTPTAGQCASTTTLDVTIIPIETPTFNPIPDVCYGTSAPSLISTSNNGYSGTWNPAIISNTASGTYTFTPNTGQCASITTLDVIVTIIQPSFTITNSICVNATAPLLPTTSNNGITGSWNPATVDNLATANYTFTPDPDQCAPTKIITITVNPYLEATFNPIGPICFGSIPPALQLISNNGYSGTWSPATISNTDSGTYTFTPNPGECTFVATLNVIVIPNIPTTFEEIDPICSGSTPPVLPATSTNNITGTWSPAIVSNTESKSYNFTPNYGQCGTPISLSVTVYPSPIDIIVKTTDVVNDAPDGIIEIISVTSGQSPFEYKIDNSSFTTDVLYSNLPNGDYTITVRDSNGCEFNKIVTINSICVFPNAISPNGDAFNESFNLKGCDVVKLEIFNRYGRKVNSYSDYSDQWDGKTSGGEALPDGTYFYSAEIKDGTSKSGWIYIAK
jgi:gliding motility-associated-like protein